MRLTHNLMSLNVYRSYNKSLNEQSKSMGKISSGDKIARSMDDPVGMGQREYMRMQLRGLQMAQKNMQDGISMLQAAEGGLDSITSALNRIRELTVSAGGAKEGDDKASIQAEIDQMIKSIDTVAKGTEFNGVKLLANEDPSLNHIRMASGSNVGDSLNIPMNNLTSDNLTDKTGAKSIKDISGMIASGKIGEALDMTDAALDKVLSVRSKYGALQNRMESLYNIQEENSLLIERADSNIGDADIAEEMMGLAKHNLLVEAGNAMMVQTNRLPQDVLRVLERVR
ncbi:flagellin [Clostridium sp. MSJ-4]|uniref:Flagellin n=1 Tax=Clostridium simiarum TaxID=2841506 RepID=A0ABS6EY78_9CLOT|nr:flagellin [Clostridium simiarum]MBU5591085.1 flagellin [Clostridium simiarum]